MREHRTGFNPGDRSDIDDARGFRFAQGGDAQPAEPYRGQEVDLERFPPVRVGQFHKIRQLADGADVVDQHVEPAELFQDLFLKRFQIFQAGEVGGPQHVVTALDFFGQCLHAGFTAGAPGDPRSGLGEGQREGPADAVTGAGDEDFSSGQIETHVRILSFTS